MYLPKSARKFNLRQLRMENDRKNGAIIAIILLGRFEKYIALKNTFIFKDHIFSEMFSLKYIPPLVAAAAAAAAAAAKHDPSCICMIHHVYDP